MSTNIPAVGYRGRHICRIGIIATLAIAVLTPALARAQTTYTWTGNGTSPYLWNNASNWDVAAPVSSLANTFIVLDQNASGTVVNTATVLNAAYSINTLTF